MNENKPVLFRERPFREKRIQALLAQFRTPILLFSPFRGKEVRGVVSKKSMKHQKVSASVPLWFKIPHFESKYKKSQERLIYFLKHIGKEYKKQNKSYFSSCIPQSSRSYKDDDSFIDKSVSRVVSPCSLNKQNRIHYFTDIKSRDKFYNKAVRRYEDKQHIAEQSLSIRKTLRKQDSVFREAVRKTYLAEAQVFFDSYPDIKRLLHFNDSIGLVHFAQARKGYKAILGRRGFDKKYFRLLESYQERFQQDFDMHVTTKRITDTFTENFYDVDYPSFRKIIKYSWLTRLTKFFSGKVETEGKAYSLPSQLKGICQAAGNLLGFSVLGSFTEFLENIKEHIVKLKKHKFSDSLIRRFRGIIETINSEREIVKDTFFYSQNKDGYKDILIDNGYSKEVIGKLMRLLKHIMRKYHVLQRSRYSDKQAILRKEGMTAFSQQQSENLEDFFKGSGDGEEDQILKLMKRDLNFQLGKLKYVFELLKPSVEGLISLEALASVVYGIPIEDPHESAQAEQNVYLQRARSLMGVVFNSIEKKAVEFQYSFAELLSPLKLGGSHSNIFTLVTNRRLIDTYLTEKFEDHKEKLEGITKDKVQGESKVRSAVRTLTTKVSQNKLKYAGIILSIFGMLFLSVIGSLSSQSYYLFPADIQLLFYLLQVILSGFFFLFHNYWKLVRQKLISNQGLKIYMPLIFLLLPWIGGYICFELGLLNVAQVLPFISIVMTYLLSRNLPEIIPNKRELHITEHLKNISIKRGIRAFRKDFVIKYHRNKFVWLWISLFIISVASVGIFFLAPQYQLIFYGAIFGVIILFTCKGVATYRRRSGNGKKRKPLNEKIVRVSLLFVIFLNFFTLLFAVSSIASINSPNYEFALISQEQRVTPSLSQIDFSGLEYTSSLEDINDPSINDEFVIKATISPFLGASARVSVTFYPLDVPPIDGYYIKPYYGIASRYVTGPLEDYDMITRVPLNTLNLAPGSYRVEIRYSELTGFGFRIAAPQNYEVLIGKDTLRVLSNERFKEPLEYGYHYDAVYGFEYELDGKKSWSIIYDGQIVDSLLIPVQLDDLRLYIEESDQYVNIANVSTDKEGKFYLNHTVYGWIEENVMVRIGYQGDEWYNELSHEEYGGLETEINDRRFFRDKDRNGYPDWDFDLSDLIRLFSSFSQSQPSGSLVFMAVFNENTGLNTYDLLNNYQGIIQGGTSWDVGKRDSGLYFDGDGQVLGGGGGTIGTTIYNAYANISYEYYLETTSTMSPQSTANIERSLGGGGGGDDFKVLRGTTIISSASATATITEGTDYTLESGQDSTSSFIRITNTRLTGMGRTSGGGNQNNDDFEVWIQNPSNIATSITFERTGTVNDARVTWEILQYIGSSGGANEMIVRDVGTATTSGTTASTDGATIYDTISK